MKSNFTDGRGNQPVKTKGIAIRLSSDLLQKIDQQDTSRNELVSQALTHYFNNNHSQDMQTDDISTEQYEEIYSTLYNNEVSPLKKTIQHQQETIQQLELQINDLKQDKQFLMNHCNDLATICKTQKKQRFWHRKHTQDTIE